MPVVWRWIVVVFMLIAGASAAYAVKQRFFGERVVRIAVDRDGAPDAVMLGTINDYLQAEGRRFRLRIVPTGSAAESQRLLRLKQVDLASVRADAVVAGPGLASILVLYQEAAVLLASEGSKIESWSDLNRRAIALAGGTTAADPLVQTLLRAMQVEEVLLTPLADEPLRQELQKKTVQGVAFVGPVPGSALSMLRRGTGMRDGRLTFTPVEVSGAEAFARANRRYSEVTLAPGTLRTAPPLPEEEITTVAVARHLMVRESNPGFLLNHLVHALLDAKRALSGQHPLLAQMGAPDLEADAHVRVHPGPRALFQGEERPISEIILEWIYLIPLLAGAIGTGLFGLVRWLKPRKPDPADLAVSDLIRLRREAGEARSTAEVAQVRRQLEAMVHQVERLIAARPTSAATLVTALDLADRQLAGRLAELDRIALRTGRPQ